MRLIFFIFIFSFNKTNANDSILVKFIDKKIEFYKFGYFSQVKIKHTVYLFTGQKEDTIDCFVFKKNILIASGKLNIEKDEKSLLAIRNGYWRVLTKNKKYEKIYFLNDSLLKEEKIPVKDNTD